MDDLQKGETLSWLSVPLPTFRPPDSTHSHASDLLSLLGMTSSNTNQYHCQPKRKYVDVKPVAQNWYNPIKHSALDCFAYMRGDENKLSMSGTVGVVLSF